MLPCDGGQLRPLVPNKYYCKAVRTRSEALADTLHQCERVSVPVVEVDLDEAMVHPENIGHFGRDMAFLAAVIYRRAAACVGPPLSWPRHL